MGMYDVEWLREVEFPLSREEIYFNHASISPLPVRVKTRMQWALEGLAAQPFRFWIEEVADLLTQLHEDLAGYIGANEGEEIVLITSTSYGINALAQSIDWRPGDNMLFCEWEFPANAYPWMSLERDGVEVRLVPAVHGGLTLPALEPLVDERTRVIAASGLQFFSGHRTDLTEIGRFCRERDIRFVVDAIQCIGHMKIDVQEMGIDALITGGQKSLLCAPGIGFMYIRGGFCAELRPRMIGANATRDFLHWLDYDLTPRPGAARFMMGTSNVPAICGLEASLSLLNELGVENIDRHTTALAAEAMEGLEVLGYRPVTPRGMHGPIVTFPTGRTVEESDELAAYLGEQHVALVRHLDPDGNPYLRISFHCYNTLEEVRRFLEILDRFD